MDLTRKFGFAQDKIWVLKGGMYGWQEARMPTVKSADALRMQGPSLYAQHCSTCHQAGGGGIAGVVPPLAGSAFLRDASGRSLLTLLFKGANSGRYQTQMPAFWRLSDAEIAAIADHVRARYGPPEAKGQLRHSYVAEVRAEAGASPALAAPSPAPHVHPPGAQH